jgi:quinolinate synthase
MYTSILPHKKSEVAPITLDKTGLKEEIARLKKEKNACILAHYYQEADIQDVADYLGDSLYLAKVAERVTSEVIVFAGVHFMAETAKIINPSKRIWLPDLNAGCSLADSCPPEALSALKAQHPDALVVTYINCTAEIKALSDLVCTSSNAVAVINSIDPEREIIFAPDRNLGRYLIQQTGRPMILWEGACVVHEAFAFEKIVKLFQEHPDAQFIAHPESESAVLDLAKYIGSTSGLLDYVQNDSAQKYIVGTEVGIIHEMKKRAPHKTFIPAPVQDDTCACSECAYMKVNTLEKLYRCLRDETPEIFLSEDLIARARKPIQRMLEIA